MLLHVIATQTPDLAGGGGFRRPSVDRAQPLTDHRRETSNHASPHRGEGGARLRATNNTSSAQTRRVPGLEN